MNKKVVIIGAGFAGISAATKLASEGYEVTVLEKNDHAGGRARKFAADGFTFDMGPSWYWMPDVFEKYFQQFNASASDFYDLVRLDPSYRIFFGAGDTLDLPANLEAMYQLFESLEPGSSVQLKKFLKEAKYKYDVGINDLVYKPGKSIFEFADMRIAKGALKLHIFQSFSSYVRKYFKHPKIIQLLEFPVLFLGAMPQETPALYSLMNYADINLGTWYPMGGMHKVVEGMVALATSKGVQFQYNTTVEQITVVGNKCSGVITNTGYLQADAVIGGADYHHVEQQLLPEGFRTYSEAYWNKRVMAPSSLIFYLGVSTPLKGLQHHNLFFDRPFDAHAQEIYKNPQWPTNPLFYVSCPSKTDDTVAPKGAENLFVLIPVAPGLEDNDATRERYYNLVMERLEQLTSQSIREHVVFKRSYAHADFIQDYNAFKGNAYGLANTLKQTAILKPSIRSKKIKNLYYTGQLTVPGPGVPPSIISGQVVANEITNSIK